MQKLSIEMYQYETEIQSTKVDVSFIDKEGLKEIVELPFDQVLLPAVLKSLAKTDYQERDYQEVGRKWLIKHKIIYEYEGKLKLAPNRQRIIGEMLFNTLFGTGKLHDGFILYKSKADELKQPVNIEIRFDPNSKLVGVYPWELLHDGEDFLFSGGGSLWRYITLDLSKPTRRVPKKIKVLLISPRPSDSDHSYGSEEKDVIHRTLDQLYNSGIVQLDSLDPPTFENFQKYLINNRGDQLPHIIHFDGHGTFGRQCKCGRICLIPDAEKCDCKESLYGIDFEGFLEFENPTRNQVFKGAQEIADLLSQARFSTGNFRSPEGICLIVLSACRSGFASIRGETLLNGVAQRLMKAQIPAVVAMQFDIEVTAAVRFFETFYQSIANQEPLISAVSSGRTALGSKSEHWYRPVLYMRWQDDEGGRLFDFTPPTIEEILRMNPEQGYQNFVNLTEYLDPGEGRERKLIVNQEIVIKNFVYTLVPQWRSFSKGHILTIWGGQNTGKSSALDRLVCLCELLRNSYSLIYSYNKFLDRPISPDEVVIEILGNLIENSKYDSNIKSRVEGFLTKLKEEISEVRNPSKIDKKPLDIEKLADDVNKKLQELYSDMKCNIVLLFDDVNDLFRNDDSRKWMMGTFLPRIREGSPGICVVITSTTSLSGDMKNWKYVLHHSAISNRIEKDIRNFAEKSYHIDNLDPNIIQNIIDDSTKRTGEVDWEVVGLCLKYMIK